MSNIFLQTNSTLIICLHEFVLIAIEVIVVLLFSLIILSVCDTFGINSQPDPFSLLHNLLKLPPQLLILLLKLMLNLLNFLLMLLEQPIQVLLVLQLIAFDLQLDPSVPLQFVLLSPLMLESRLHSHFFELGQAVLVLELELLDLFLLAGEVLVTKTVLLQHLGLELSASAVASVLEVFLSF